VDADTDAEAVGTVDALASVGAPPSCTSEDDEAEALGTAVAVGVVVLATAGATPARMSHAGRRFE